MLDPPAFTKSRENIGKAISGYKEINLRGMKLLRSGGFLVTSSCTNLVSPQLFLETIRCRSQRCRKKIKTGCLPELSHRIIRLPGVWKIPII